MTLLLPLLPIALTVVAIITDSPGLMWIVVAIGFAALVELVTSIARRVAR